MRKIINKLYILLRFPKGFFDFILSYVSFLTKSERIAGRPVNATIELTNICNQACPVCETGAGILKRKKGSLSLENYKIIIDKIAPFTNTVLLYFMGESFLNPDIYKIIKYTKSKKIFVKICTNGTTIDPVKLIDSGIDEIQFQIGGISQETHQIYRKNSDLSQIIKNISLVLDERKQKLTQGCSVRTKIYLGLIFMKQNETELDKFFKLSEELGVDEARIELPGVRTVEQGGIFLPSDRSDWIYDPESFDKGLLIHKNYKPKHCKWMYFSITVTWDGFVIPCCRDVNAEFIVGNLLMEDFSSIWNGKSFSNFRKKVFNNPAALPMCLLCDGLTLPSLKKV